MTDSAPDDREAQTQAEIRADVASRPEDHDETTSREAAETALMDEDASEAGEVLGDKID